MATYRAVAASETDALSPITSDLMTALADNPTAITEGADDAPYVQQGWHPHNGAEWADGLFGSFYKFSTDGAATSRTTAFFDDGYEYRIVFNGLFCTAAASLRIEVYGDTSATWMTPRVIAPALPSTGDYLWGQVTLYRPMWAANTVLLIGTEYYVSGSPAAFTPVNGIELGVAQKVSRARMSFSSGDINGGEMYLMRRRMFGPV